MGGKASKSKGQRGERAVSKIINDILGTDIHRNLDQARDGRNDLNLGKYKIEVKLQETTSIPAWWRQAVASCDEGDVPLLIFRRSREEWKVCLTLEEFLFLIKQASKDIEFRDARRV
jgi:hypothetical protein